MKEEDDDDNMLVFQVMEEGAVGKTKLSDAFLDKCENGEFNNAYEFLAAYEKDKNRESYLKQKNMKKIPSPSVKQVEKYCKKWRHDKAYKKYPIQERILEKLFKQYPNNTNKEEVLYKVSILNDFYSTRLSNTLAVVQHIVASKIDQQLRKEEVGIVEKIAKVEDDSGKIRRNYSFATKYCSHHQPDAYPIYDSYVSKVLAYFNEQDNFPGFTKKAIWKDYPTFMRVIEAFRERYKLKTCTLKEIDRCLFVLGKEKFPKKWVKGTYNGSRKG
jgi:hypothetical protein